MKISPLRFVPALLSIVLLGAPTAQAGVQNLTHFQEVGSWSVGLEPELTLATSAGVGANFKFTYGLNEISNVQALLGTGGASSSFRAGGTVTFDFFPDLDGQPGIGVAVGGLFHQRESSNGVSVHAFPYIHKGFETAQGDLEPYLAVPVGIDFSSKGTYEVITSTTVGLMFKTTESLRTSFEFSIPVSNADTVVSAGVTYYH